MAFGEKRGGERMLESRHVIGAFLLMVVVSGVVFTLGYVLGRSQSETPARVDSSSGGVSSGGAAKGATPAVKPEPGPVPAGWELYRAADSNQAQNTPKGQKATAGATKPAAQAKPSPQPAAAKSNSLFNAPLIPRGSVVVQVAAVTKESDALALAEALQQKKFPAFVLTPSTDHYYRVQVGPYADAPSANVARRGLEKEGFKSIVKR